MNEEFNMTFVIPANYTNSGKAFNGMFETRNLVEAALIAIVTGYIIIGLLPISTAFKFILIVAITLPLTIVALIGIDGDSLTQFLFHAVKFKKNKRKLHMKRVGYVYNPAELKFVEREKKERRKK